MPFPVFLSLLIKIPTHLRSFFTENFFFCEVRHTLLFLSPTSKLKSVLPPLRPPLRLFIVETARAFWLTLIYSPPLPGGFSRLNGCLKRRAVVGLPRFHSGSEIFLVKCALSCRDTQLIFERIDASVPALARINLSVLPLAAFVYREILRALGLPPLCQTLFKLFLDQGALRAFAAFRFPPNTFPEVVDLPSVISPSHNPVPALLSPWSYRHQAGFSFQPTTPFLHCYSCFFSTSNFFFSSSPPVNLAFHSRFSRCFARFPW